jgi:hypothetical protein
MNEQRTPGRRVPRGMSIFNIFAAGSGGEHCVVDAEKSLRPNESERALAIRPRYEFKK